MKKIRKCRILHNKIQCSKCKDIIESLHRHDFKWCSCQRIAVDGGTAYLRRCFCEHADVIELTETESYIIEVDDDYELKCGEELIVE